MGLDKGWRIAVSAALVLVLMGAAWITFAPVQFGGQASYVIISGNSMEPLYHRGDLVILRQASDYVVGDIVTYRHPDIGPIIHRITAESGSRFILKGDNNSWTDSYQPTRSEILGQAWIHLPGAGKIVERIRQPAGLAAVAGLLSVMFVTTLMDWTLARS